MPLTGMGLNRGQDDTVALKLKVRAPTEPEFLGGQVWDPPHLPPFSCPQMRCLATPALLRALAQVVRAGRTKGSFPGCGDPVSWPEVAAAQHNLFPCRASQCPEPPQQRGGGHLQ